METYQIFLVPMVNAKNYRITMVSSNINRAKYQARDDLDDKEAPKDSVAPSDNIEKAKVYCVAPSAEIDKTTK